MYAGIRLWSSVSGTMEGMQCLSVVDWPLQSFRTMMFYTARSLAL